MTINFTQDELRQLPEYNEGVLAAEEGRNSLHCPYRMLDLYERPLVDPQIVVILPTVGRTQAKIFDTRIKEFIEDDAAGIKKIAAWQLGLREKKRELQKSKADLRQRKKMEKRESGVDSAGIVKSGLRKKELKAELTDKDKLRQRPEYELGKSTARAGQSFARCPFRIVGSDSDDLIGAAAWHLGHRENRDKTKK
ncbi:MAG TPA: hypothetical protein VIH42_03200 [Thermoguttaceae bacterium]